MEIRQIKCRIGQIEYPYNDQVPWTHTDQQMADGLAHAIILCDDAVEEVKALAAKAERLSKLLEAANSHYLVVEPILREAQDLATIVQESLEIGKYPKGDELDQAVNRANEELHLLAEQCSVLHHHYVEVLDIFNHIVTRDESHTIRIYDELSSLFTLGCNAPELATDLMGFNDAIEDLESSISYQGNIEKDLLKYVDSVIRDYEMLSVQREGQIRLWEEFGYRLELLQLIIDRHSGGPLPIGLN